MAGALWGAGAGVFAVDQAVAGFAGWGGVLVGEVGEGLAALVGPAVVLVVDLGLGWVVVSAEGCAEASGSFGVVAVVVAVAAVGDADVLWGSGVTDGDGVLDGDDVEVGGSAAPGAVAEGVVAHGRDGLSGVVGDAEVEPGEGAEVVELHQ